MKFLNDIVGIVLVLILYLAFVECVPTSILLDEKVKALNSKSFSK